MANPPDPIREQLKKDFLNPFRGSVWKRLLLFIIIFSAIIGITSYMTQDVDIKSCQVDSDCYYGYQGKDIVCFNRDHSDPNIHIDDYPGCKCISNECALDPNPGILG